MNALSRIFQTAAEMVFAVLAPASSRVARIAVRFHDELDTASTDGNLVIRLPRAFAGRPIPDDAPLTLGLLAHELGHWVQPLREVTEVAQQRGAPFWLANIVADIHGETFVEAMFPALKAPLQTTRQAVHETNLSRYQADLAHAIARRDFLDTALNAALIARFGQPDRAWDGAAPGLRKLPGRVRTLLDRMQWFQARHAAPAELPALLAALLDDFPELTADSSQEQEASSRGQGDGRPETGDGEAAANGADQPDDDDDVSPAPGADAQPRPSPDDAEASGQPGDGAGPGEARSLPPYPVTEGDDLGRILKAEMQATASDYLPSDENALRLCHLTPSPPDPRAVRLARTLTPRFLARHGALQVAAPGQLHRLDLARGAPIPLRMDLPGHETPAPLLLLAIDLSSSMFTDRSHKAQQARIAAQAITLALRDAGGQVTVILFNSHGYVSASGDDSLAFLSFSDMAANFRGGTAFTFLDRAWRRWPQHQTLVLTDGDGFMPRALPRDRARTAVLLIASQMDVSAIADRAIPLDSLDRLASLFALLIPERR